MILLGSISTSIHLVNAVSEVPESIDFFAVRHEKQACKSSTM